jgi:hypothetical protein
MYFDIWQMLLDVFNRLYKLSAHRISLAQLMTGAQTVVQQRLSIYSNFVGHAQAFLNATDNIALADPDLVTKLNNFVDVAVPEFLSDPIFSLEPVTSYENLHVFESYTSGLRGQFEEPIMYIDTIKEYIKTGDYFHAVNAIILLRSLVSGIATISYSDIMTIFNLVINTSVSSTVTKYTAIQFVCAAWQVVAALLMAPIALLQWILTKLKLEIVTQILAYSVTLALYIPSWIIDLCLHQVYGADVYNYLLTYKADPNATFITHLEPDQLESLNLLSITYCDKYIVGVPVN